MHNRIHVQDFHNDQVVDNQRDLLRVLARRYAHDANLFTLASETFNYPWLNAYVRGSSAVLYYLPAEGEMYASAGGTESEGGIVEFYDSEVSANQLSAKSVIPWPAALICIEEFCSNFGRAEAIEWLRLH
jgi:hypothetical protein